MTSNDPFAPPPEPGPQLEPGPPPLYPQYQQPPGYPPPAVPGYLPPGPPLYAPPGYGYPQPPPGYGYPPPPPGHGKAIAGLVLGILGLVLCWVPILDIPLWILALVFSILGRSEAKKGAGGGGQATAGLVCAIIATVANIVLSVLIFTIGLSGERSCADQYGRGTTQYENCMNN
jgi:hypothetical protein